MDPELPQILSNEEIDNLLKARGEAPRPEHDCWDNSGVRPPAAASDGLPESSIEQQFPHIVEKLLVVWPSEACGMYISDLVVNRREARQGFPQDVVDDLLMLHQINDMLVNIGKRGQKTPPPTFTPTPLRRQR